MCHMISKCFIENHSMTNRGIYIFLSIDGFRFLQQILLIRSRNKQNYEHADENKQIVDKKTQGSMLEYRVSI